MTTKMRQSDKEKLILAKIENAKSDDEKEFKKIQGIISMDITTRDKIPSLMEFRQSNENSEVVVNYLIKYGISFEDFCRAEGYRTVYSPKYRVRTVYNERRAIQRIQNRLEVFYLEQHRLPTRKEFNAFADCPNLADVKRLWGWNYRELVEHATLTFDVAQEPLMTRGKTVNWSGFFEGVEKRQPNFFVATQLTKELRDIVVGIEADTKGAEKTTNTSEETYPRTFFANNMMQWNAIKHILENVPKGLIIELTPNGSIKISS